MPDDYYVILGVPCNASNAAIKQAYHRLVLQCHPDANPTLPGAEAQLRRVIDAYKVLGDAVSRLDYDVFLGLRPLPKYCISSWSPTLRYTAERRAGSIKAMLVTVVLIVLVLQVSLICFSNNPIPLEWQRCSAPDLSPRLSEFSLSRNSADYRYFEPWSRDMDTAQASCFASSSLATTHIDSAEFYDELTDGTKFGRFNAGHAK